MSELVKELFLVGAGDAGVDSSRGDERFRSWAEAIIDEVVVDPFRVVLRACGVTVTGGEFAALTYRYARALTVRGVGPGDRVAILADHSPAALAVRYAIALTGAASTFSPDTGVPGRLVTFLGQVEPSLLVVFPSTAADAEATSSLLADLVVSVGPVPGLADLGEEAAAQSSEPFPGRACPDDVAVLIASGGTTGASKASVRSFADYARMLGDRPMTDRRLLVCGAFAYVTQVVVAQVLGGGGVVTLTDCFDPVGVLEIVESERITHLTVVEPQLVDLADRLDGSVHDLSSLVRITHVGAPAPASLRRRLLGRLGPVLANTYGMSEAGMVSVLAAPEYDAARPGLLPSSGRPLPGVDVVIRRRDGSAADRGEEGGIEVRVPGMATGYRGRPNDTRFRDGWYATGDLGVLDQDGYLTVRGRATDARTVDGSTVMPVDLENAACAHPEVRYAVALPVDQEPAPFAVVAERARHSTLTDEDLRRHLHREILAGWVGEIIVVDDLPLTEQGKPDRLALHALLTA